MNNQEVRELENSTEKLLKDFSEKHHLSVGFDLKLDKLYFYEVKASVSL